MLEQQLGDRLRGKINDDKTYDVSYYAQTYSKADYGTTQVAVLAPNGDHPKTEKALGRRWTKGFFFFFTVPQAELRLERIHGNHISGRFT